MPGGTPYETTATLTPILDSQDFVSVFASTNEGLIRSRQKERGLNEWERWSQPGFIPDNVQTQAVNIDMHGHIYVAVLNFARKGMKNVIYGAAQTNTENAQWTSWQRISIVDSADKLSLEYNANGALTMFAFDSSNGTLRSVDQVAPDSTEWYLDWTTLGKGLKCYSVTKDLTPN